MEYYRVLDGHTFVDGSGKTRAGGDVVELETDSEDKLTRLSAEGVLVGQHSRISKLSGKPEPEKKSPSKKKATYKTKDATPEG